MFCWGRLAILPLLLRPTAFPMLVVQPGPFRGGVPPAGTSRRREEVCLPPSHPCPVPLPSRVESLEALPVLSRNPSRSTDRDWETASAASSLASVAEYTGASLVLPCGEGAAWGGRARRGEGGRGAGVAASAPAPLVLCVLGTWEPRAAQGVKSRFCVFCVSKKPKLERE